MTSFARLLQQASPDGLAGVVQTLLRADVDKNWQDLQGKTALMHASEHGRVDIVSLMVEADAGLDYVDTSRKTALMWAAASGHAAAVRALTEAGADTKAQCLLGKTAACLHSAFQCPSASHRDLFIVIALS